eukprot:TRINITY_DN3778_c0_g1_i4.p1 TRINITY_DN3778_c0_g1~~TRINITY_DN3778_c0_g1_i4.p1  ORF type:complete len:616 (-),score=58.24 TRINITY_DN3778_c0_g1_i4:32-1756(-)
MTYDLTKNRLTNFILVLYLIISILDLVLYTYGMHTFDGGIVNTTVFNGTVDPSSFNELEALFSKVIMYFVVIVGAPLIFVNSSYQSRYVTIIGVIMLAFFFFSHVTELPDLVTLFLDSSGFDRWKLVYPLCKNLSLMFTAMLGIGSYLYTLISSFKNRYRDYSKFKELASINFVQKLCTPYLNDDDLAVDINIVPDMKNLQEYNEDVDENYVYIIREGIKNAFYSIYNSMFSPDDYDPHKMYEYLFFYPQRIIFGVGITLTIIAYISVTSISAYHDVYTYVQLLLPDLLKMLDLNPALVIGVKNWLYFGGVAILTMSILLSVTNLLLVVKNFKKKIMELRQGEYRGKRDKFNTTNAGKYIGYQLSHSVFGFILQLVTGLIILLFLMANYYIEFVRIKVWNLFLNTGLAAALRYVIGILLKFIIFKWNGRLIRYPVFLSYLDYADIFISIFTGLFVCVTRLATSMLVTLFNFGRMDLPIFSPGFETLDAGYSSYMSMVMIEHTYNNPITITYREFVVKSMDVLASDDLMIEENLSTPLIVGDTPKYISKSQRKWHLLSVLIKNKNLAKKRKSYIN